MHEPAYTPPQPHRGRRIALILGAAILAVLAVGAIVSAVASSPEDVAESKDVNPLEVAQVVCDSSRLGTRLEDSGGTLIVDSKGEEDFTGVDLSALDCILGQLHAPEAIKQKISSTRALDGRQDGTWTGLTASWTYHPDDGLDLIVTRAS